MKQTGITGLNGWRCPQCGSDELSVDVIVNATLSQTLDRNDDSNENEYSLEITGEPYWDKNSNMDCNQCGYQSQAANFEWHSGPRGTLTIIAEQHNDSM